VLAELGRCLVAIDGDLRVVKGDGNLAALAGDTLLTFLFPCFAADTVGRVKIAGVGIEIAPHVLA